MTGESVERYRASGVDGDVELVPGERPRYPQGECDDECSSQSGRQLMNKMEVLGLRKIKMRCTRMMEPMKKIALKSRKGTQQELWSASRSPTPMRIFGRTVSVTEHLHETSEVHRKGKDETMRKRESQAYLENTRNSLSHEEPMELVAKHEDWVVENWEDRWIEEEKEEELRWYAEHFVGKKHYNFLVKVNNEMASMSLVRSGEKARLIIRTTNKYDRVMVSDVPLSENRSDLNDAEKRLILKKVRDEKLLTSIKEVKDTQYVDDLLAYETNELSLTFKWGVLHCKKGQTTEENLFENSDTTGAFGTFLSILGRRIILKDWKYYNGGLDVCYETTGRQSIYTRFGPNEIMFHVSAFLPKDVSESSQQIERKRHLGNDIVLIVFLDPDVSSPFAPDTIQTHFQHILAVVQPLGEYNYLYRVQIARKKDVPEFGPSLTYPAIYTASGLQKFLVSKLIAGERAALSTSSFSPLFRRTRAELISQFYRQYA